MANDINVVVLVGRLTKDCEVRTTASGTSVCRFSIASNRRRKNGEQWIDEVSYFDIVLWGRSAETLRGYLTKGKQVSVEGELRQDRWEQDGQTRSKIEIVASNVQLLSNLSGQGAYGQQDGGFRAADSQSHSYGQQSDGFKQTGVQSGSYAQGREMGPEAFEEHDSDIPF